jgi:two-component system sensor histidine kinase CpxA
MKPFSSLFTKILFWFFLNLVFITGVLAVFFTFQSQIDIRGLFGRKTSDRVHITGKLISHDLSQAPAARWPDILERYGEIHQVDFVVVLADGRHVASSEMVIPERVMKKIRGAFRPNLRDGRSPPPPDSPGGQRGQRMGRREMHQDRQTPWDPPGKRQRLMMRTKNPVRYWIGTRIRIFPNQSRFRMNAALLAVSDSITGNGFFFDPLPWMVVTLLIVLLSVLLWIPLIRNITRPVVRMTRAAEEIAKGRFEVKINEPRSDEIGRLAGAINHMTSRLNGFVKGQKRFLGDIAHELGSPMARIQVGLGILEQETGAENRSRLADVMEDADHMSNLIKELLSFSKAEINQTSIRLAPTALLPVVQKVVQREVKSGAEITTRIDPGLHVTAAAELLSRALANIVRNTVEYAEGMGPIDIAAEKTKDAIEISIRDSGPGVPEEVLSQLFEPFFRPEPSRGRDSGGVGLGLAIVKTCIDACNGTVSARNLKPRGFEIRLTFPL